MSVLLYLVVWALATYFQFSSDSNAMAFVLPMLAAMQVGNIWFNKTGMRPANGPAWKAATLFALVTIVIGVALGAVLYTNGLLPELDGMKNDPNAGLILAGVIAVLFIVTILLCRGGLSIGARQADKLKARMDAKRMR